MLNVTLLLPVKLFNALNKPDIRQDEFVETVLPEAGSFCHLAFGCFNESY